MKKQELAAAHVHSTRSCSATCRLTRKSCENGLVCTHAFWSTAQPRLVGCGAAAHERRTSAAPSKMGASGHQGRPRCSKKSVASRVRGLDDWVLRAPDLVVRGRRLWSRRSRSRVSLCQTPLGPPGAMRAHDRDVPHGATSTRVWSPMQPGEDVQKKRQEATPRETRTVARRAEGATEFPARPGSTSWTSFPCMMQPCGGCTRKVHAPVSNTSSAVHWQREQARGLAT